MIADINDCRGCDNCYGCGAKHVKVLVCDKCGDPINDFIYYSTKDGDFCEDCFFKDNQDYTDTLTVENAMKLGDEYPEKVLINQFLASVYSAEQISDILLKDFSSLPGSKQTDLIRSYAEDEEGAADWCRVMAHDYHDPAAERITEWEVKND